MSLAKIGIGAQLKYSTGGAFTKIAEVKDISGPGLNTAAVDVTNQDSVGYFREKILGLSDGNECTFTINYAKAQIVVLQSLVRVVASWQLILVDNSTWAFSGFLSTMSMKTPVENPMTFDCTITITGVPTFTSS